MRPSEDNSCYEYVACYVDDLLISIKRPDNFCKSLKEKYDFKLKGDGPINYHLGMDYLKDKEGTLVQQPKKYFEKMVESYQQMFKEEPPK